MESRESSRRKILSSIAFFCSNFTDLCLETRDTKICNKKNFIELYFEWFRIQGNSFYIEEEATRCVVGFWAIAITGDKYHVEKAYDTALRRTYSTYFTTCDQQLELGTEPRLHCRSRIWYAIFLGLVADVLRRPHQGLRRPSWQNST